MKKNIKSTKSTPTIANGKMLKRLNEIFKEITKSHGKLTEEYRRDTPNGKAIEIMENIVKKAQRSFDDLASCLPPVKFNSAKGEYFLSDGDKPGTEKFAIRVRRVETTDVMVEAKTYAEAFRKATAFATGKSADGKKIGSKMEISFCDLSERAN